MELWKRFEYLHYGRVNDTFEKLVIELYSHVYRVEITNSFINHAYIENEPVHLNGNGVGFQAKCAKKFGDVSGKLLKDIPKIAKYENESKVNKMVYFFSFDLGQNTKTLKNTEWQKIEEEAESLGIDIEYWGISKILRTLEKPENYFIYNKYFECEPVERYVQQYQVSEKWKKDYIQRKIVFEGKDTLLENILEEKKIIFLVGDAGIGKSVEIDRICSIYNDEGYNTLKIDLISYLGESLGALRLTNSFLTARKSLILFDGYDDINNAYLSDFKVLINKLRSYKNLKIIISGRTIHYFDSDFCMDIPSIKIKPLSSDDIDGYLKTKLRDKTAEFYDLAKKSYTLEYLKVPFYLVKLTYIYSTQKLVPRLYDMFEILLLDEIEQLSAQFKFNKDDYLTDLMNIAIWMINEGKLLINHDEITFKCKEVTYKSGWLSLGENTKQIRFIHKNFPEFLFAKGTLAKDLGDVIDHVTVKLHNEVYLVPKYSNIVRILSEYSIDFAEKLQEVGYKGFVNHEVTRKSSEDNIEKFISITKKNVELDYWFAEKQFTYEYLSTLMDSEEGTRFLLNMIDKEESLVSIHIAVDTLINNCSSYDTLITTRILSMFSNDLSLVKAKELLKILERCSLKKEEFEPILEEWYDRSDSGMRAAIYFIINSFGWEDYFLDYLLKGKKIDINAISSSRPKGDIYNISEGANLSSCLDNIKSIKSIEKMGSHILTLQKRHRGDYVSGLESHYERHLEKIGLHSTVIKSQFLDYIEHRLGDIYERDCTKLVKLIQPSGFIDEVLNVVSESLIYDFRKVEFLGQISHIEYVWKIINFIKSGDLIKLEKTYLVQLERYDKKQEYIEAIKVIEPQVFVEDNKKTEQEHFDNLFKPNFLEGQISELFEENEGKFTWRELMSDYRDTVDYDIKSLFNIFKDEETITMKSIVNWNFDVITFNLMIDKASNEKVEVSDDQLKCISEEVTKRYNQLKCTGVSNQRSSGYSHNIYTGALAKIAFKYNVSFPMEFYLLLNEHITVVGNQFKGIEYLKRYLDLNFLLDVNCELINNDYWIFETELSKRINFLAEHNDYRVKDKLLSMLSRELSDSVTISIVNFFVNHNRVEVLFDYLGKLSSYALKYLFRNYDTISQELHIKVVSEIEENEDVERHFVLSSIALLGHNPGDVTRFLTACKEVKRVMIKDFESFEFLSHINDIESLSDLLIMSIKYKKDDFDHSANVVLNNIENYFSKYTQLEDATKMNDDLYILSSKLISSEIDLTNRYLMYVDRLINLYLNQLE